MPRPISFHCTGEGSFATMSDWEHRMRDALLGAADQFAMYADHHLAKVPPDREKAAINLEWAARCREAAKAPDAVEAGQ